MSNQFIDALPLSYRRQLLSNCETTELAFGAQLYQPNELNRVIYFPLTCILSLAITAPEHPSLTIGLIGHEGLFGAHLALGIEVAPCLVLVDGSGQALQMSAARLQHQTQRNHTLRQQCERYLWKMSMQWLRTTTSAYFAEIEPRLAGWILMMQDRTPTALVHLTHQILAKRLGVRRSGITLAAGTLQQRQLIDYHRGVITIIDRPRLETAAGYCYERISQ